MCTYLQAIQVVVYPSHATLTPFDENNKKEMLKLTKRFAEGNLPETLFRRGKWIVQELRK